MGGPCWGSAGLLLLLDGFGRGFGFVDDSQHFVFSHDEELLTFELDLLARVLAEENEVSGFHVERLLLAVVLRLAVAGSDDLALLGLFLGGVGDDDAPDLLFAFLDALDNDAVVQRSHVHFVSPSEKGCSNRASLSERGGWHSLCSTANYKAELGSVKGRVLMRLQSADCRLAAD